MDRGREEKKTDRTKSGDKREHVYKMIKYSFEKLSINCMLVHMNFYGIFCHARLLYSPCRCKVQFDVSKRYVLMFALFYLDFWNKFQSCIHIFCNQIHTMECQT